MVHLSSKGAERRNKAAMVDEDWLGERLASSSLSVLGPSGVRQRVGSSTSGFVNEWVGSGVGPPAKPSRLNNAVAARCPPAECPTTATFAPSDRRGLDPPRLLRGAPVSRAARTGSYFQPCIRHSSAIHPPFIHHASAMHPPFNHQPSPALFAPPFLFSCVWRHSLS